MNGMKVLYAATAPMTRSKAQSDEAVSVVTQEESGSAVEVELLSAESSEAPVDVLRTPADETAFIIRICILIRWDRYPFVLQYPRG